MRLKITFLLLFFTTTLFAQDLTISSTGDTGASGTNWSISGTTLTVTGTANIQASVIENALSLGNLNINAVGDILINQDITATGTANLSLIAGNSVKINSNITTVGDLYVKAVNEIEQQATSTTTTNGGNVVYWANSDGNTGTYNFIRSGIITTNGGHVWLGGSLNNTGIFIWNGLTVGAGYASSDDTEGVSLRGTIDTRTSSNQSIGGDVWIAGESGSGSRGDVASESAVRTIYAGNGDIALITHSFVHKGISNVQTDLITTGQISLAPVSGADWFDTSFTFNYVLNGTWFEGANNVAGVHIANFSSIGGLNLGTYQGTGLAGDSPYVKANLNTMSINKEISIAGSITVYGGTINVNKNITSTSSTNSTIYLQANQININSADVTIDSENGDISFLAKASIAASKKVTLITGSSSVVGGDVLFSADTDATSGGQITMTGGTEISTFGGNITFGGGNLEGTSYSEGTSSLKDGIKFQNNVILDTSGNSTDLGGDIRLKGKSFAANDANGIIVDSQNNTVKLDAGNGRIIIDGISKSTYNDYGVRLKNYLNTISLHSSAADSTTGAADAITISGQGSYVGVYLDDATSLNKIHSSGTGGITILGSENTSNPSATVDYDIVFKSDTEILAKEGAINISTSSDATDITDFFVWDDLYLGQRANTAVASSSSNITISANKVDFSWAGDNHVNTSGSFTFQSSGASFLAAINTNLFNYSAAISGLTIGKSTNTANITVNSATTIAGPITMYGGDINVDNNLASSSDGSAILIKATNSIRTSNSQKTIATNNGNISIIGDSDANGVGVQDWDYTTYSAGTGNILFRGETFNFTTNPSTARPNITSTSGSFTFESSDASFGQATDIGFFNIPTTLSGLTIGKSTNTDNITVDSATTIAGPITMYGGDITVSGNLDTSGVSGGDILLKASDNITVSASKSITTDGGDVTLWSNSDGGTSDGGIYLDPLASISTLGGNLWMGGSLTSGSSTAWNGLTVGDGYSVSGTAKQSWYAGVFLDEVDIDTTNGNIYIAGKNINQTNGSSGFISHNGATGTSISSGTGTIEINGVNENSSSPFGIMFGLHPNSNAGTFDLISSSNETTAIKINGSAIAEDGILIEDEVNVISTGTGNILITGDSTSQKGLSLGNASNWGILNILSASGDITLDMGDKGIEVVNASGTDSTLTMGSKASSSVTSSTSDISLISDSISISNLFFNTSGELNIKPTVGNSFTSTFDTSGLTYSSDVSGLTIGHSANTGDITVGSATTIAGDITLYGGDIAINNTLEATNSTITLDGSGTITDGASGYLVADNLALLDGAVTLDNTSNNVGTIAASNLNAINYVNAEALEIGSVGSENGITSTGSIDIATLSGNLTVSQNVSTLDGSTSAIVLNAGKSEAADTATGGDIIVSGTPTITFGTNGIAKLFSGSEVNSTSLTTLAGGSSNTRFGVDETTVTFDPVLELNNTYALYREATTLNILDFTLAKVKLYPNPSQAGYTHFMLQGLEGSATITLYNTLGQQIPVNTKTINNGLQVTPNYTLSSGMYLVLIKAEGQTSQLKWLVE